MKLRAYIEKFSRGRIFKRTLPQKFGGLQIFVSPEAGLRYYKLNLNNIDHVVTNTVDLFVTPNDVIWDVGANLGLFSLCALGKEKTCSAICFEPDIFMCELLRRSTERNNLPISILPFAAAESFNFMDFEIAERSRATNHLAIVDGSTQTGGTRTTKKVPVIDLNTILTYFPKPTFLKVDVEGAELIVIKGAKNILDEKPKILIEVNNSSYKSIMEELINRNYSCYDANLLPELVGIDLSSLTDNILALPK